MRPERAVVVGALVALVALVALLLPAAAAEAPGSLVLTGTLRATDAERLAVPMTSSWQLSLQWLREEGATVAPGDPIARFDPGATQTQLYNAEDQLAEKRQEREADQAQARLRRLELELELKRADVAHRKAALDADIPQDLLEGKDYRERQLRLARTRQAFEDAERALLEHDSAARSKQSELEIEERELASQIERLRGELDSLTLRASRAGIVVHEDHQWFGRKVRVGDRMQATMPVASIPATGALKIEAWAGETDAVRLAVGQRTGIVLDADPGARFAGRVELLSNNGERRESWGRSSYTLVTVVPDEVDVALMKPGMSVRCEVDLDAPSAASAAVAGAAGAE